VIGGRRWFLGASTEWPGVEPAGVELGNPWRDQELPGASEAIRPALASLRPLQLTESAMRFGSASGHGT